MLSSAIHYYPGLLIPAEVERHGAYIPRVGVSSSTSNDKADNGGEAVLRLTFIFRRGCAHNSPTSWSSTRPFFQSPLSENHTALVPPPQVSPDEFPSRGHNHNHWPTGRFYSAFVRHELSPLLSIPHTVHLQKRADSTRLVLEYSLDG